ncbi:hypothetical protein CBER1_03398 [Cercospora berteroae]|uniref:Efflux pump dotC n=1 Tax=Cercospora berteroae TaxID=357750 RepID=A0A2S6C8J1_9PEZI|nr:hypothetical protein CBER1_03398 [Cercospora berteroae]
MEATHKPSDASAVMKEDYGVVSVEKPESGSGRTSNEEQQAPSNAQSTSSDDEEQGQLDGRSKAEISIIMFALSLACFLAALDTSIVATALPVIAEHFQAATSYSWVGSAYLLAHAAGTGLWAKWSDIFGRKPSLIVANIVFFVGSLVAAVSNSIGMLIAGRAIQGAGGGGLVTLVDVIIADLFSVRTRGMYLGIVSGVWAIASALGPVVGGALTQGASWRWCFWINLPLDAIAIAVIVFFLKVQTPRTPFWQGLKAVDWLGTFSMIGGTLLFLFGLHYGGITFPWDSATVICLIVFGIVLFAAFVAIEWKFAKLPILPLRMFKARSNWASLVAEFFHALASMGMYFYLPFYFQSVKGRSPLMSGVLLLPNVVATSLGAAMTGGYIAGTGNYWGFMVGGFVLMTLGIGLFIDLGVDSNMAKIVLYQIVAGLGTAPNYQALLVALQTNIRQDDVAAGTAAYNFIRGLGVSISLVVGQALFTNEFKKQVPGLVTELGAEAAAPFTSHSVEASIPYINQLADAPKYLVRQALSVALRNMWILYTVFAAGGLVFSLLVKRYVLTIEHTETEVGLEAQRRNEEQYKAEQLAKKEEKKMQKQQSAN